MSLEWVEVFPEDEPPAKAAGNRGIPSAQCACGRFAKYVGTKPYYNGTWNMARMTVECSRCGTVDIELV